METSAEEQRVRDTGMEMVTTHVEIQDYKIPPPTTPTLLHFPFWKGRYGWRLDSGSSCDLVEQASLPQVETHSAQCQKTLETANGIVQTDQVCDVDIPLLQQQLSPFVVDISPALLSLGKRCMLDGFSFNWPAYQRPTLTTPQGKDVLLPVENSLPWLTPQCDVAAPVQDGAASDEAPDGDVLVTDDTDLDKDQFQSGIQQHVGENGQEQEVVE